MIYISNCSESVFRFYTEDPKQIQQIIKWLAEEILAEAIRDGDDQNGWFTKPEDIPLYKTPEEYDTGYKRWDPIERLMELKDATREKRWYRTGDYKNVLLKTCAGLGDNEVIITYEPDKKAIRINIGNNWISSNETGWIDKVKELRIDVEEAEFSEELREYARDCTCGITYFGDYDKLKKDK